MDQQHAGPPPPAVEDPLLPHGAGAGSRDTNAGTTAAPHASQNNNNSNNNNNNNHHHDDDRLYDDVYYPDVVDGGGGAWWLSRLRRGWARALASRRKHFVVMAVVALDVTTLLANIFIQLIACEARQADEPWVKTVTAALEALGLIFSTAFVVELVACLAAFGWRYLSSMFHLFDATVIVLSFLIDISLQGPAESIGSLVVMLRLWRLAKISEEVVLGATERMEMLEHHIDELEAENKHLRAFISSSHQDHYQRERQSSWT